MYSLAKSHPQELNHFDCQSCTTDENTSFAFHFHWIRVRILTPMNSIGLKAQKESS